MLDMAKTSEVGCMREAVTHAEAFCQDLQYVRH